MELDLDDESSFDLNLQKIEEGKSEDDYEQDLESNLT
jgi:hypothetical protein